MTHFCDLFFSRDFKFKSNFSSKLFPESTRKSRLNILVDFFSRLGKNLTRKSRLKFSVNLGNSNGQRHFLGRLAQLAQLQLYFKFFLCNNSFYGLLQLITHLKTIKKYTVMNWAKSIFGPIQYLARFFTFFNKS